MEVADEFLAVRHAGLLQDVVHMHLHGAERDAHGRGYVLVVLAEQHLREYFLLFVGKPVMVGVCLHAVVDEGGQTIALGDGRPAEMQVEHA